MILFVIFAFLPFRSYSPCFTQKYQFLRFHFNNSKFSFADLLKFIHNVRSHFFILEFVGGKFHVSAQLRNFNVLKQCFDHIKQGKFEFDFYSFYDSLFCPIIDKYIYICVGFHTLTLVSLWQMFWDFCTMFFFSNRPKSNLVYIPCMYIAMYLFILPLDRGISVIWAHSSIFQYIG